MGGRAALPGHLLGHFLKGLLPGDAGALGCAPLPGVWLQGSEGGVGVEGEVRRENRRLEAPGAAQLELAWWARASGVGTW